MAKLIVKTSAEFGRACFSVFMQKSLVEEIVMDVTSLMCDAREFNKGTMPQCAFTKEELLRSMQIVRLLDVHVRKISFWEKLLSPLSVKVIVTMVFPGEQREVSKVSELSLFDVEITSTHRRRSIITKLDEIIP